MNTVSKLSRNQFGLGNQSVNGRGKSGPMIEKLIRSMNKKREKEEKHLAMVKALYAGNPIQTKVRKPRVFKKKAVIDSQVLAKISSSDVATVEQALKEYLDEKLKEVVFNIGENGKTVTLASVKKVLEN